MRLPLNLARAPSFRERYGLWVAIPGLVLALALFVWLAVSTLTNYHSLRVVEQGTTAIQSRRQDLQRKEAALRRELAQPEAQHLIHEAAYLNGLIDARKFSVVELTAKVSKLMPPDVRLDALTLARPGERPLIRFTVEGKTEPDIEAFLTQVENSNDFSDLIVTSQSYPGGEDASPIMTGCSAHYLGGPLGQGEEPDSNADTEKTVDTSIR